MKEKVASRYLLPLELILGISAIAWGLSGDVGGGAPLWGLCVVGFIQFAIAGIEWITGRGWGNRWIFCSVCVRATASLLAAAMWLYVIKLITESFLYDAIPVAIIAPSMMLFSAWSFYENYKVRHAIDERIPTSKLEFHR